LALEMVKALNAQIGRTASQELDPTAAVAHLDRHRWGARENDRSTWAAEPWLGAVAVPAWQAEPYLSGFDLSKAAFREQVLQPALFGASAIFDRSLGTDEREEADRLVVEQRDDRARQVAASLAVHLDGTLVYGRVLGQRTPGTHSTVRMFVIDQDEVQRDLAAFAAYAGAFYGQLPQARRIANLYVGVSLSGISHKGFGRLPAIEPQQMTIPDTRLEDPLRVPQPPLRVARAELAEPEGVGHLLTEHIARAFRVAGGYYMP
jgi:hypothetical protein